MTPDFQVAATGWLARRDAGLSVGEREQLRAWLAADPRHAAAFAAADVARTELDWPLHAGATDEILAGLERRARRRHRRRATVIATAAAAVILLVAAAWRGSPGPDQGTATMPSMVVKVPLQQTLPDGTIVDLKEGARITTEFTARTRRVTLAQGTAHFRVTKESRPFVVDASGVTAQALGTAFSVELERGTVSVLVTEGRVAVNKDSAETATAASTAAPAAPPEPLAILDAGRAVSVSIAPHTATAAPAVAEIPAQEVEDRLAWRIPRLEFSGTPLREVVARVNQHNVRQFVIADASLERLALSGVLRADKVDALVAMLESDFDVKAEGQDGTIILRQGR
jgi:transmembrane sensor